MKYFICLVIILSSVVGCSNEQKDIELCDCVEAGARLNKVSASFFDGSFSEARKDSLEQAKSYRDSMCARFQNMEPEALQKAAKDCSALNIETEIE